MRFYLYLLVFSCLALKANSQNISVYFTQSVDNQISVVADAQMSHSLDDTIKKLIDLSQNTLDLAVWDNGSSVIVGAINDAYNRGVQVRYITSSNASNSALGGLNSNIPVLERNSGLTSNVMHNKFIIVDGAKILTGSMNFGEGSMFDDFNNIVIINDQNLASTYTVEFNEMWGSSSAQPNTTNSKFGPDKIDNTTHVFNVGGTTIDSYFSPTDNTTVKMVNAINTADYELEVAMFTFINNDLGDAVIAAKNRGVKVRCIIENINYFGSEYNSLINAGIEVLSHASTTFDFHHKYCIIDGQHSSSDPMVITGSHNWTNSAEQEYDENTIIIHNYDVAQQYTEEFYQRWQDLGGTLALESLSEDDFFIYPNPTDGTFNINLPSENNMTIAIYDIVGHYIKNINVEGHKQEIDLNLSSGTYLLVFQKDGNYSTKKLEIK